MSVVLKAPNRYLTEDHNSDWPKIFLAGSIDMGNAENWQERLERELKDQKVIIYNPRRDDWDSSWTQSINNPQFNEQVTWELDHIEDADLVLFYFDPNGLAPITLMELGYAAGRDQYALVCCPSPYWRKGNVEMICDRAYIELVDDIELFICRAKQMIMELENEYGL